MRTVDTDRTSSFDDFYLAEFGRLRGALALYAGDDTVGEELAQEAMARAWQRWRRLGSHADPAGWVHRTGLNLARSRWRRRRVAERAKPRLAGPGSIDGPDDLEGDRVRDALATLTPRQREAVVYRFYGGFDTEQTATVMGCAAGTVRALSSQAFAALRDILEVEE